jgi:hypothetical protein
MTKDLTQCDNIQVCKIDDKTTITISRSEYDTAKYTQDFSQCKTPELPPELPHTGAGSIIGSGLGLSAVAGAAHYYGASRRSLYKATLKR